MRLGLSEAAFWALTPYELSLRAEIFAETARQQHQADMAHAWHVAALSKADPKRFPSLEHFLRPRDRRGTIVTHEDAEAMRARQAEAIARAKAFDAKRAARGQ